ncbi:hypothetical protein [Hyunsoonleella pacifica]|uniref:Uncharacterized protein n=1 Tax=Hyunsoonleella pacifica TaxID=1080224 RepID=A0A4Q9FMI6_9FLAO|nr:hypothetical protein [Hyunsoonleella pacifica]TBN15437.1 hypothetical protein EYD46_09875 [Hyunsoonleella pacifica]GGD24086.1 hypothetical protein GCM10011368_27660 [Hyunsoonleella pacifica]
MKESIFDEIGKLNLNKEIELLFDYGNNEIKKFYLESNLEGKLVFKPLDKYSDYITLFKKDSIENTGLKIEELKLKIEPLYLCSSGITELIITKDKKTEYRRIEKNYELEVTTFSDSAFHQLEQYLEILKFDKYKEIYDFPGFDGTNYELNLKTNLYSKTIKCTQRPTEGLRNLMSFMYLKLQTEQKITTN